MTTRAPSTGLPLAVVVAAAAAAAAAPPGRRSGRYAAVEGFEAPASPSAALGDAGDDAGTEEGLEVPSTPHRRDLCLGRRAMAGMTLGLVLCVIALSARVFQQRRVIHRLQAEHRPSAAALLASNATNATLRWLPLPSPDTVLTRLAFGSCARQDMPQPYWDTLSLLYRPQLVLLMGDNVYGDCRSADCRELVQAYADLAAHPSVRGAARTLPVFATLDDHDYGQGDCHADNPYKDLARRLFAAFYNVDEADLPPDGVYRSRTFGPVGRRLQVILLDTRYARSPFQATNVSHAPYAPVTDPAAPQRLLGERQWAWLAAQLAAPAELRLVVSSIQVLNDACPFEAWRQLPRERDRLFRLLRGRRDVLLLSGDRHTGAFLEAADGGIREVTASSWTHTIPLGAYGSDCRTAADCDEPDPRRVGDQVRVNHFGSVEVDWERRQYVVALRRAETTYGTMYRHDWDSDAGTVIQSRNYSF